MATALLAADLDDDSRLVDQVDILVAAHLLPVAEADERMEPLALPFLGRDQPFAPALELGPFAEDRAVFRRQLALPDAEPRWALDRPTVEQPSSPKRALTRFRTSNSFGFVPSAAIAFAYAERMAVGCTRRSSSRSEPSSSEQRYGMEMVCNET